MIMNHHFQASPSYDDPCDPSGSISLTPSQTSLLIHKILDIQFKFRMNKTIYNLIQCATRENANVYSRSTAKSPMSVKIVEISRF